MKRLRLAELTSDEIIATIQSGNDNIIDKIYLDLKPQFLNWAVSRFSLSQDDITDCFQDSVIAFYEQIIDGRLETLEVNLKTYLFAIGRNKMLYKLRGQKSTIQKEQVFANAYFLENEQTQGYFDLEDIEEDQRIRLEKAIKSLSPKNRAVLISRYYDGLSLEKIQEKEGYKSINAVSATLSRALSNLKKIINPEKTLRFLLSF